LKEKPKPENDNVDEISELEKLQHALKRERVAWATLLQKLSELTKKHSPDNNQNSNHPKP